jgi:hypothetical protein
MAHKTRQHRNKALLHPESQCQATQNKRETATRTSSSKLKADMTHTLYKLVLLKLTIAKIQYSLLRRSAASTRLNTTFRGLAPSPSSGRTDFKLTIAKMFLTKSVSRENISSGPTHIKRVRNGSQNGSGHACQDTWEDRKIPDVLQSLHNRAVGPKMY